VADGKVFLSSLGKIYCLDEDTAELIWSYDTGYVVSSSPAVVGGKVFFGSWDNKIYCLDEDTGELIWSYETGSEVRSSPAVADGKVFFSSNDKKIYCLNADTGELIWSYESGSWLISSPAIADGKVFFTSAGTIYCLNEYTGELIWSYEIGYSYQMSSSPAVADGKVFVGSGGKIYCFGLLPPTAYIDLISPDPAEQEKDTVEFRGHGSDLDGFVVAYQWTSNIDVFLSDEEDFDKPASELSVGTHTLFFKVKDDDGAWSTQEIGYVTVKSPAEVPPEVMKGDFDDDFDIDFNDFVAFAAAYGSELGDANYNVIGDFDDDIDIDFNDFVAFAAVYGYGT